MDHTDEYRMYRDDRAKWAQYAAPRWIEMLRTADAERFKFLRNAACPELRRAIWARADAEMRQRLKESADAQ